MTFEIVPVGSADRARVGEVTRAEWGEDSIVVHGTVFRPSTLPGFLARSGSDIVGLVTYHVDASGCEIVSLNSFREGEGIGTALVRAVEDAARAAGCTRLRLTTTNDNLHALRFYQRRGFRLAALYPGAVAASRRIKPEIPPMGNDGIPIRDEIELERPVV